MSSESTSRSDFKELKEVIKEILYNLDFAYNYRLQKLVFYGDIWCLQNFGKRLTSASFKPFHHGSYSEDIVDALDELASEDKIEYRVVRKNGNETRKYLGHREGGRLSSGKKRIVKEITDETDTLTTDELAQFTKQTWLFNNTEKGEPMDFEYYAENVILLGADMTGVLDDNADPVDVDDFESLVQA